MKIAVLYKTKYNTTKLYSGWIALKLGADLYEINDFDTRDFKNYDVIMFGLPVYMDKIKEIDFLINNYPKMKDKRVILFTVGGKKDKYICDDSIIHIEKHHFRGRLNFEEISLKDKVLIISLKQRMADKKILLDEERDFYDFIRKEKDLVDKKNVDKFLEKFNLNSN